MVDTTIPGAGLPTFIAAAAVKQGIRAVEEKVNTGSDLLNAAILAAGGVVAVSATPSSGILGFAGKSVGCAAMIESGDLLYNWGRAKIRKLRD